MICQTAPFCSVLCRKLCVFLVLHPAGHHHERRTRRRNRHAEPQENHRFNHRHFYSRLSLFICFLLRFLAKDTARCCARSRACRPADSTRPSAIIAYTVDLVTPMMRAASDDPLCAVFRHKRLFRRLFPKLIRLVQRLFQREHPLFKLANATRQRGLPRFPCRRTDDSRSARVHHSAPY